MKATTIPTVVAALALAGVLLLLFERLDADPAPQRQESQSGEDPSLKIAALERRIKLLEQEVVALRSYQPERKRKKQEADPLAAPKPEPEAEADSKREERAEPDRTARRIARQAVALDRLAEEGKIAKLTSAQLTDVEKSADAARKRMAEIFAEIRNDPANEGLEREQRLELMKTEFATVRQEFENDLAKFLPASDAQVIAEALLTNRGRNSGRSGRGRRGRGRDR